MPATLKPTIPPPTLAPPIHVLIGSVNRLEHPVQWVDGIEAVDIWCPVLGPTGCLLLSTLARNGSRDWDRSTLARSLGVSMSVLTHTFDRLVHFELAQWITPTTVVVVASSPAPRGKGRWS